MKKRSLTLNLIVIRPAGHFHLHLHPEEQTRLQAFLADDGKVGKKQPKGVYTKAFLAGLKPDRGGEP